MSSPWWTRILLRALAPFEQTEEVLGDLEEAHRRRLNRSGPVKATLLTSLEALDMARALVLLRVRKPVVSLLDFKLGFRMLVRYPGLTLVGVPAIAFAVVASAGTYEFIKRVADPTLPLDEGHRVVGLIKWDAENSDTQFPRVHEFESWRDQLRSVDELSAFRRVQRNIITADDQSEPVVLTEITSSGFALARVPPLLGRTFDVSDETKGAPNVLVISFDAWQERFGADPDVLGHTVRLGNTPHTIVGVMPSGFAFPMAEHYWRPLRLRGLDYELGEGPAFRVFGRLAAGVSFDEAKAELTAVGLRYALGLSETERHVRPELLPYPRSIIRVPPQALLLLRSINFPLFLLMLLVCGNVALLMFARAASRESEIVVRSALGASRGRIIAQLVAEAMVLGGLGALLGIAATSRTMRWALRTVQGELMEGRDYPFWFDQGISPSTLFYTGGVVLIGSVIMGVVPALKMTGRGVEAGLKHSAAGGNVTFGGVWTAIIVMQVAVTVTFPVVTYFVSRDAAQIKAKEVPFPSEEYVIASLALDREMTEDGAALETPEEFDARFARTYEDLKDRLAIESAVTGVTFADRLPLQYHPHRRVVLDAGSAESEPTGLGYRVSSANVSSDFLEVVGVPFLSGRAFSSADAAANPSPVLVNQSFVDRIFGGRNPIGRRLRYLHFEELDEATGSNDEKPEIWHRIVGVVPNMAMAREPDPKVAGIYHPARAADLQPLQIAVHVVGDPRSFEPRLRALAGAVDPALRVTDVMPLSEANRDDLEFYAFWFRATLVVSGIALVLALAGIFAVMSFTVSRKTREIGIRVALGSTRRSIVLKIFRRPAMQVTTGLLVGAILVGMLATLVLGREMWPNGVAIVLLYSTIMAGVCMLACVVPVRRALAVEPAEALRADG